MSQLPADHSGIVAVPDQTLPPRAHRPPPAVDADLHATLQGSPAPQSHLPILTCPTAGVG